MKKILVLFAAMTTLVATAQTVSAQDNNAKKPHVAGYNTNKFWDNWEIQAGAGPSISICTGSEGSDIVSWNLYAAALKWFHPIFALRLAIDGGRHSYTSATDGNKITPSFIYFHPDLVFNLSNWIGGYKERVYNADLLIGGGVYATALETPSFREYAFVANIGLQNRFNVCKSVSIDLSFQYCLGKPLLYHDTCTNNRTQGINVTAGVTYRFNKRGYDRAAISKAEADAIIAKAVEAEAKASQINAQNVELEKKLNNLKAEK